MTDRVGIHEASSLPMVIVVMGVSGCGKSTLARRLALARAWVGVQRGLDTLVAWSSAVPR